MTLANEFRRFGFSHLSTAATVAFGDEGPELEVAIADIRGPSGDLSWSAAMQQAVEAENARLAGLGLPPIDGLGVGYEWVPDWAQPTDATDAWRYGVWTRHDTFIWRSMVDWNVWEPGVYGWRRQDVEVGPWSSGTGPYQVGEMVTHPTEHEVHINRRANNVWEPGTADSGWLRAGIAGPHPWMHIGNEGYPAEWRVTHPHPITSVIHIWRNPVPDTHWQPGVAVWIDEGPAS